ncbi:hypothetical protein N0B31_18645 [Salinirubellus salinus]|uniref:Uncharacterized protein n=1 Tax=Salinirubellus salinus TaxID=1364945 RepID=A0A9E7UAJ8_9EURY|nr:hypothetical protein [Salinirubellus salinus]UWM54122.1 hypothetical protein N0B31_18645 [Salinirubellus salinus]
MSTKNDDGLDGRTKIDSFETAYQVRDHPVEFEIDVVLVSKPSNAPAVELEGRLSIDGTVEPEATVRSEGEWMARPELPAGHPIVQENEEEYSTYEIQMGAGESVTEYEMPPCFLPVPDDFYQSVFEASREAVMMKRQRLLRRAEALGCEIEVLTTWVDKEETILYAEAVVKSRLRDYRLHCRRGPMAEPNWRFYAPDQIPDEHSAALHHFVRNHPPISQEDYAREVEDAARGDETVLPEQSPEPVCQAKGCTAVASRGLPAPNGYPDGEWKLCQQHFGETRGYDPYQLRDLDWTLRKLRYRESSSPN